MARRHKGVFPAVRRRGRLKGEESVHASHMHHHSARRHADRLSVWAAMVAGIYPYPPICSVSLTIYGIAVGSVMPLKVMGSRYQIDSAIHSVISSNLMGSPRLAPLLYTVMYWTGQAARAIYTAGEMNMSKRQADNYTNIQFCRLYHTAEKEKEKKRGKKKSTYRQPSHRHSAVMCFHMSK